MRPGTPITRAGQIAEELALFGLSDLETLIGALSADAAPSRFSKSRTVEQQLALFLRDSLVDIKTAAEAIIPTLANAEAARLDAEEAEDLADAEEADDRRRANPLEPDYRRLG